MALFTRTAKLDSGAHGARCAWAMAIHYAVGISRQRNSGYRPSRVNIMAQGLSIPINPTHLSVRKGRATTTHYTHHQVSLMVLRNTTLVSFLGLCTGPACEAGLSIGMWRERVPHRRIKIKDKDERWPCGPGGVCPQSGCIVCTVGGSMSYVTLPITLLKTLNEFHNFLAFLSDCMWAREAENCMGSNMEPSPHHLQACPPSFVICKPILAHTRHMQHHPRELCPYPYPLPIPVIAVQQ